MRLNTAKGDQVSVQRSEITDIDHPGNVAATIGVLLAAYGVANAIVGTPKCSEEGAAFCIGVYTRSPWGSWRRTSLLYFGPTPIVTPTSVATGFGLAALF